MGPGAVQDSVREVTVNMVKAMKSITLEVAEYSSAVSYSDLPQPLIRRAKEAVTDGLGVMLAGHSADCARVIRSYLGDLGVSGKSSVIGESTRLPAQFAALANGVSGHALDFDDTQISSVPDRVYGLLTHPTVPVLSAALAQAEERGAGGRELLAAFCAGVEVACKVAETIAPRHYQGGFHSTGTIGVVGAAAAARLMELDIETTRHAIGIAASKSAGIRVAFGTMTKPYHAGAAGENGVVAAKLARLGYTTDPDALDGRWGFFQVAGGGSDPHLIQGKLGNPYAFVDPGVSIKPYPCGSLAHPSMDAMLELVTEHDVRPEAVEEIKFGTSSHVLNALRYGEPHTELEAKFSIPFCMAILALEDRRAGIGEFTDETVMRPDVREMMGRVVPYLHDGLEARGFERILSLIEVRLKDGTVLSREASTSRGTPERPMTRDELAAKFHDCARETITPEREREALDMVYALEDVKNVGELTRLVSG